MSEQPLSRAEQDVVAWLVEDGPREAPDLLVERAVASFPHVRRVHSVETVLRSALVAVVGVMLAMAVVAGIATLRTREVGPPPTAAPSSASASPGVGSDVPCPPSEVACGRALAPGTTYAPGFDPRFTFSVPDEHWLAPIDVPGHLLVWTVADNRRRVGFYRDPQPLEPDGSRVTGIGDTSADLLAWLRGHPELVVGEPHKVSLAELEGQTFDVTLRGGATSRAEACPQFDVFACFPLLSGEGLGWSYELGVTVMSDFRMHLFDLPDGGVLLVTLEAHHETDLAGFAERAAPLLDSLQLAE